MNRYILTTLFLLPCINISFADCMGPPAETITINVQQCAAVIPSQRRELLVRTAQFSDQKSILNAYEGLELDSSLGKIFIPTQISSSCSEIVLGKEYQVTVDYACCDGDPNPPCYLGYSQYAQDLDQT